MSKPTFWSSIRKIRPPHPRQASLYAWLTFGMIFVVAVTVFVGGLPAIGITWWQLDRQVQLRVQNAQSSTQALYVAEQKNFLQLAQLIADRPTLCALLQSGDIAKTTSYLNGLRQTAAVDSLFVVTAEGQILTSGPVLPPSDAMLDSSRVPFADFAVLENPPRLAIFSVSKIASTETCQLSGVERIVAVRILDHDFMQNLAKDTGLEQSLIIGNQRVATSFVNVTDWPLNPDAAVQVQRTHQACCTTGQSGGGTYYVGLAPLLDNQGNVIALSEVALPATDIRRNTLNTAAAFLGIGLLAALTGMGLALFLSRRISRPLSELSEAAERMGAGDLETPIPVASGWLAIDRLASQIEHSRQNLRQIQRITRRELRRIVHLLGATREGVVTINTDGILTWANTDACHILGYDILGLLRKHYSQVFRPADGEMISLRDILQPVLGRPLPNHLTVLDAQDSPITLSISHSVLDAEDESPGSFHQEHVLILQDVSEEQASDRLRSEFLANVAHEFRTPLSAISASTELLMEEGDRMSGDEVRHLAHTLNLSSVHLQALVNNLLESAIIEAGVFRLRLRPLQPKKFLQNLVNMMLPLLQQRQQQLDVDSAPGLGNFWCDPDRLNQALVNLIENASKFSPSAATIRLAVRHDAEKITFAVLDSGPGLPSARFSELFNRFVKGDRPHAAQYGIGLGLPIVKAIAEAHGGRVGAENRPGGGARVWFTIPLSLHGNEGEEK